MFHQATRNCVCHHQTETNTTTDFGCTIFGFGHSNRIPKLGSCQNTQQPRTLASNNIARQLQETCQQLGCELLPDASRVAHKTTWWSLVTFCELLAPKISKLCGQQASRLVRIASLAYNLQASKQNNKKAISQCWNTDKFSLHCYARKYFRSLKFTVDDLLLQNKADLSSFKFVCSTSLYVGLEGFLVGIIIKIIITIIITNQSRRICYAYPRARIVHKNHHLGSLMAPNQ